MLIRQASTAILAAVAVLASARNVSALDVYSAWSASVGKIYDNDETAFCEHTSSVSAGIFSVNAKFRRRGTDGNVVAANPVAPLAQLSIKMQCMNPLGVVVSSPESAFGNTATLSCPAASAGVYIKCRIRSQDSKPFTYGAGGEGAGLRGDPCGNGIASIGPSDSDSYPHPYKGQVTGQRGSGLFGDPLSEMTFANKADHRVFASPLMTHANVYGTDMGFMFYYGGSLWAGYGDTWDVGWDGDDFPWKRGSVLFSTKDLTPANGLTLDSFESATFFGNVYAREVVPSCHNQLLCPEASAIPTAGFGLRDAGVGRRFLWFNSIAWWLPFISNGAGLAWEDGNEFKRPDTSPWPIPGKEPPRWTGTSHFGAGAIYQDRFDGYIYFFGVTAYAPNTPVRLARVKATFASVMDRSVYQYWDGAIWKTEADTAPKWPSEPGTFLGAADIIKPEENVGPEFSVAFDAYANRYIMLIVHDRGNASKARVQLWQSKAITGPWEKVTGGAQQWLPNTSMVGGQYPGGFFWFYGPYTSEQTMVDAGKNVYYQLSEWNGLPGTKPYNTGLWGFRVNRHTSPNCQ
jgi:Domain of unknown function (DUF4185)